MSQIATNSQATLVRDARLVIEVRREEWTVTLSEWSDGTHTLDASREIDTYPVPLPRMLDEYEIDLGTDAPTVERIIEAIDEAVEARADAAWESYLSSYYGG